MPEPPSGDPRGAFCQSRLRASSGLGWLYVPEPPSGELSASSLASGWSLGPPRATSGEFIFLGISGQSSFRASLAG